MKQPNKSEDLKLFETIRSLRASDDMQQTAIRQLARDVETLNQNIILLKAESDKLRNQIASVLIHSSLRGIIK